MANNTINIAVKREKLIASVKKAIELREQELKEYEAVGEHNRKQESEWLEQVKSSLGEPKNINVQAYRGEVEVTYTLPAGAVKPQPKSYPKYIDREELNALKNGLVLLEMSEEDVIKTASYGSISKYL